MFNTSQLSSAVFMKNSDSFSANYFYQYLVMFYFFISIFGKKEKMTEWVFMALINQPGKYLPQGVLQQSNTSALF